MCEEPNTSVDLKKEVDTQLADYRCGDKGELTTSKIYETFNLPHRFECPYLFQGYGAQKPNQNPFYRTANSEYGWYTPNEHSVPHRFFPRTQEFSTALAKAGMYRNYSLNTSMDRTFY